MLFNNAKVSGAMNGSRGGSIDEGATSRVSDTFLRPCGAQRAADYTSMADDSSMSPAKREACMLFSAAEQHLEEGDAKECLKVAEDTLSKFRSLGADGKVGGADTLHLMVDAHRLDAAATYRDPSAAKHLAKDELAKFKDAKDQRGEATMQLALAEIAGDDRRMNVRKEALGHATEALTLAKSIGDRKFEAKCLLELAFLHYNTNELDKMKEEAQAASRISEEMNDRIGKAMGLHSLALALVKNNAFSDAIKKGTEATKLFAEAGNKRFQAGMLNAMAVWHLLDEKPKKALPLAEQALAILKGMDKTRRAEAAVTFNLCDIMIRAKNAKGALKIAKDAADGFQKDGLKREEGICNEALAAVYLEQDAPDKAIQIIEATRKIAEDLGDKRWESRIWMAMSTAHHRDNDLVGELEALEKSRDVAEEAQDFQQMALALREIAYFYMFDKDDFKEGLKCANSAATTSEQDNDKVGEAIATMQIALCNNALGENSKSLSKANECQEICQEVGYLQGEAGALMLIAELKALEEKYEAALEAAEERLSIFRELRDSRGEAKALKLVGTLHKRDKNFAEAEKACKDGIALAAKADDEEEQALIGIELVQIYLDQVMDPADRGAKNLINKASKAANDSAAVANKTGDKNVRGNALFWKAQALMLEEKLQDAQRAASEAEACFRGAQSNQGQSGCLHLLGTVAMISGHGERALDTWDKALGFAQKAKDASLEFEVKTSIFNLQQRMKPAAGFVPVPMVQQAVAAESVIAAPTQEVSAEPAKPKGLDPGFVRKQLMVFVKDVMATDDELELDSPFMEAGMDSLSSVSLMSMVAKEFQMALSPSLVFDFPTVRALEEHLVDESKNM